MGAQAQKAGSSSYGSTSPAIKASDSGSESGYASTSPSEKVTPTSPLYKGKGSSSPVYDPTKPSFKASDSGVGSPQYSATSPSYQLTSPVEKAGSSAYDPQKPLSTLPGGVSPQYTPTGVSYVPSSPPLNPPSSVGGPFPALVYNPSVGPSYSKEPPKPTTPALSTHGKTWAEVAKSPSPVACQYTSP